MIFLDSRKVTTFFYMKEHVLTVVQDGEGKVEIIQLSEIENE
jgi:hypothetical protein